MVTGAQRRRSGALQTPPAAEDGPLELGGQRKRAPPLRTPGHIYGRAAAAEPAAPRRSASHGPRTAPPLGAHSRAPVAITSGPRSRPRVAGGGSLAARPSATLAFGRRVPQDPPHAASRRGADAITPSPARNFGLPAAAAAGGAHPPTERLLRARRQRNTGGASPASRSFMSTGAAARPQRRESSHTHAPRGAAESNPTASALSPVSSELTPSRRLEGHSGVSAASSTLRDEYSELLERRRRGLQRARSSEFTSPVAIERCRGVGCHVDAALSLCSGSSGEEGTPAPVDEAMCSLDRIVERLAAAAPPGAGLQPGAREAFAAALAAAQRADKGAALSVRHEVALLETQAAATAAAERGGGAAGASLRREPGASRSAMGDAVSTAEAEPPQLRRRGSGEGSVALDSLDGAAPARRRLRASASPNIAGGVLRFESSQALESVRDVSQRAPSGALSDPLDTVPPHCEGPRAYHKLGARRSRTRGRRRRALLPGESSDAASSHPLSPLRPPSAGGLSDGQQDTLTSFKDAEISLSGNLDSPRRGAAGAAAQAAAGEACSAHGALNTAHSASDLIVESLNASSLAMLTSQRGGGGGDAAKPAAAATPPLLAPDPSGPPSPTGSHSLHATSVGMSVSSALGTTAARQPTNYSDSLFDAAPVARPADIPPPTPRMPLPTVKLCAPPPAGSRGRPLTHPGGAAPAASTTSGTLPHSSPPPPTPGRMALPQIPETQQQPPPPPPSPLQSYHTPPTSLSAAGGHSSLLLTRDSSGPLSPLSAPSSPPPPRQGVSTAALRASPSPTRTSTYVNPHYRRSSTGQAPSPTGSYNPPGGDSPAPYCAFRQFMAAATAAGARPARGHSPPSPREGEVTLRPRSPPTRPALTHSRDASVASCASSPSPSPPRCRPVLATPFLLAAAPPRASLSSNGSHTSCADAGPRSLQLPLPLPPPPLLPRSRSATQGLPPPHVALLPVAYAALPPPPPPPTEATQCAALRSVSGGTGSPSPQRRHSGVPRLPPVHVAMETVGEHHRRGLPGSHGEGDSDVEEAIRGLSRRGGESLQNTHSYLTAVSTNEARSRMLAASAAEAAADAAERAARGRWRRRSRRRRSFMPRTSSDDSSPAAAAASVSTGADSSLCGDSSVVTSATTHGSRRRRHTPATSHHGVSRSSSFSPQSHDGVTSCDNALMNDASPVSHAAREHLFNPAAEWALPQPPPRAALRTAVTSGERPARGPASLTPLSSPCHSYPLQRRRGSALSRFLERFRVAVAGASGPLPPPSPPPAATHALPVHRSHRSTASSHRPRTSASATPPPSDTVGTSNTIRTRSHGIKISVPASEAADMMVARGGFICCMWVPRD